jgi:transposase
LLSIPHPPRRRIVVGVDTHKHLHVAVAVNHLGVVFGEITIPVDRAGYAWLQGWVIDLGGQDGQVEFGVEGCGSYGAGVASFLRRAGYRVVEVNRPDRSMRHLRGKNDTIDAESKARSQAIITLKTMSGGGDGRAQDRGWRGRIDPPGQNRERHRDQLW